MRSLGIGMMVVGLAIGAAGCVDGYKKEHVYPMSRGAAAASGVDWLGKREGVAYCTGGTHEVRITESNGVPEDPHLGFMVEYEAAPLGLEVTVYQGRPVGAIAIMQDDEDIRMVPYGLDKVTSQQFVLLYDTTNGQITVPPITKQLILCY